VYLVETEKSENWKCTCSGAFWGAIGVTATIDGGLKIAATRAYRNMHAL